MKVLVPGFEHRPGVSCGPTALRDVLASRGLVLSEAMVFGLGAGLGFYYLPSTSGPSRIFIGRRLALEPDCCEALGLAWVERREPDPGKAWAAVQAVVDAGRAPVLCCDLKYLPHYRSTSHFNGHMVTLAGYDLEAGEAYVGDTGYPGLTGVTLPALAQARASEGPPVGYHGHAWYEVEGGPPREVRGLIPEAVRRNGQGMLEDPSGLGGLPALQAFAEELDRWPSLPDFRRCAKEGYYAVEKRGTGGGLFRVLFSAFLDEAQALRPELKLAPIAHGYRELAWEWGELATAMKLASQDDAWDGMGEFARRLAERERELAERLAAVRG